MNKHRYEGRAMPGPVTLAACLMELVDALYGKLVDLYEDDSPDKEALILEWTRFRDEWKPRLDRIIDKNTR